MYVYSPLNLRPLFLTHDFFILQFCISSASQLHNVTEQK